MRYDRILAELAILLTFMRIAFFILLVLCGAPLLAQDNTELDSLWNIWNDASQDDTLRMEAMHDIAIKYLYTVPDSAILLANKELELAASANDAKWQSNALNTMGIANWVKGEYDAAIDLYEQSLALRIEFGDKRSISNSYNNIALIWNDRGVPDSAIKFHQKGIKICEEINDTAGLATSFNNIGIIYWEKGEHEMALDYYEKAWRIHQTRQDKAGLARIMNNMAIIHHDQGNTAKSLNFYRQSRSIYESLGDKRGIARNYNNVATIINEQGDPKKAISYHKKALKINQEIGITESVAMAYHNIGSIYSDMGQLAKAQEYQQKSLDVYSTMDKTDDEAFPLGSMGAILLEAGQPSEAKYYLDRALEIWTASGKKKGIADVLTDIGKYHFQRADYQNAIKEGQKALEMAEDIGLPEETKDAAELLYKSYNKLGMKDKALDMHLLFIAMKDSLFDEENRRELLRKEYEHEYEKQLVADSLKNLADQMEIQHAHEEELRTHKRNRNIFMVGGIGVLILAGGLWSRLSYIRRSRAQLQSEKDRSENLLLNILPKQVAEELKDTGESKAKDFPDVTILFTDFLEFTSTSERMDAQQLVAEINICFKAFDGMVDKYKLEKIKTIGDAYMAAGGLHIPRTSDPRDVVLAAIEMQEFMKERKQQREAEGLPAFQMRVGIHTGPVVAGIVGVKKFQYDIWGDTVNTASRMESSGQAGKVNISHHTYEKIKDDGAFAFQERGKVLVKGKGELDMYFVDRA